MKVDIGKTGSVSISFDVDKAAEHPSSTGKSTVIYSSGGFQPIAGDPTLKLSVTLIRTAKKAK